MWKTPATLIDNIFTNNLHVQDSSGILLNQISVYQMVFTLIENLSYVTDVPKCIDIECNNPRSMQTCRPISELENIIVYDKLEQAIDSDQKKF